MDQQNTNPKLALIERLQQSKNILVTVSTNPSVDQLAACLGLTLWLNRLDKHATAVFSGEVPSTLEFLQPEETLEKNTDSLRDFIISLDKSKADKLRYKVEENVVKIFITPYRTSLSADDLEYSQGDFNVDTVVALGVNSQADLDTAITAHGRILHDATVATITTGEGGTELGSIQWHDPHASSLSELVVDLGNGLDKTKLDNQIATALLTGVVAQTDRFSNEKTTPQTMSVSAELMSAGANQQLVVSKLEEPAPVPEEPVAEETVPEEQAADPEEAPALNDGSLEIEHEDDHVHDDQDPSEPEDSATEETTVDETPTEEPEVEESTPEPQLDFADKEPKISDVKATAANDELTDAPILTPSDDQQQSAPAPAPEAPLLDHDNSIEQPAMQPAPPSWMPEQPWLDQTGKEETLAQIEQSVDSPHIEQAIEQQESYRPDLDDARDEVMKALQGAPASTPPQPVEALNAQPIDLNPQPPVEPVTVDNFTPANTAFDPTSFGLPNAAPEEPVTTLPPVPQPVIDPNQPVDPDLTGPVEQPMTMPLPPAMAPPAFSPVELPSTGTDPNSPPPVPPPFVPGQPQR